MRICLFRAFPDGYRKSMDIYADQLLERIRPLLDPGEELLDRLPPRVRLSPRLPRYWDQYVRYQKLGPALAGDVNHVVDHAFGHLVWSLPAARTVVTFHDAAAEKLAGTAYRTRLSLRYSLRAMRSAARIIADSEASRRDLLDLLDYPDERVRVVYPGIHPSFRPLRGCQAARRSLELPRRYILHVGNSLPYTNVEGVLRALHVLVRSHGMDIALVKVGGAFTPQQQLLLERLGLTNRVVHLGRVPLEVLAAIYGCAAVLVYPVLHAGFGLPPLEALACGTPVACSDRGALPEVLGDAAVFVDPRDHRRLATRVAELATNPGLAGEYRRRGLRRARRYSWETTAKQVLGVYREVADA